MLDSKLAALLADLSEIEYFSSKALAERNETSDRTIQTRIRNLREVLERNGATIESKPRSGYRLVVLDREKYHAWQRENQEKKKSSIPGTVEERFLYLLKFLLENDDYHKIEDFAEFLAVTPKTISSELRRVEFVFNHYHLEIRRKPHYGLRVQGREFDKRNCLIDYLVVPQCSALDGEPLEKNITDKIGQVLLDVTLKNNVAFSEMAFQNVVFYLLITHLRSRAGKEIQEVPSDQKFIAVPETPEYDLAWQIVRQLSEAGISMPETLPECAYVAIFVAGHRIGGDQSKQLSGTVATNHIQKISTLLLDCIERVYNLSFKDNLNVRMALYNHLVPFHIRMTYGIPMRNPILEVIKQNYPFAFGIAQRAMAELEPIYHRRVPEDETGYFAMILEMALEKAPTEVTKKNILLVCMTGKASSQFLAFRFRKEFGTYIQNLTVCNIHEFEKKDLSETDCVFTTVPLSRKTGVPIYEVGLFLDEGDVQRVKKKLQKGNLDFLRGYYRKELFFPHVAGGSREAVLKELCGRIAQLYDISEEDFFQSVLKRESLGGTDFGNDVAIPHPEECVYPENLVCVGILDNPVRWSTHTVELVILGAIAESTSNQTQIFYQVTSNLISDRGKIKEIVRSRDYEQFLAMLQE